MAIQFDNSNTGSVTLTAPSSGTTTLQFPTALGTAGQFLTTNGSGVLSFTSSSPTLTGFTTSITTTTPFSTVNRSLMMVGTAGSFISIAVVPRGSNGSLLACIPDGTATGGNSRSSQCVDLQMTGQRTSATQIASGSFSFIGGGYANQATGSRAVVVGGYTNTNAGGVCTIVGGSTNTITVNGSGSAILGGSNNYMDSANSVIVGGIGATAFTCDFTTVYGSNNFNSGSNLAQAQTRYMCLTCAPNSASQFQLNNANVVAAGTATVAANQAAYINIKSAVLIKSLVVQRRNSPAGNQAYSSVGLWRRGATGSPTNLVNSNTTVGTSGTVTSWGYAVGATNTTSNTAASIVTSTAAVTSYVAGYMQILDVGYV